MSKTAKNIFTISIICFICGIVSFNFGLFQHGGFFTVADDFNQQQIPFIIGLHKQIKEMGLNSWMWNLDLGSSTIQGMGFYELGSPFFWLSMVFPADKFPYIMGWIYILKYIIAGITSYLYFGLFVNDKKYAVIGAILYSFSGFQATNLMFYHFHDIVALFPLVMHSLELTIRGNKRGCSYFTMALALNCMNNYYFFILECVFLLVYYGFRMWGVERKLIVKNTIKCIYCGLVGVGISSWIFIPSVSYIMENKRANPEIYSGLFLPSSFHFFYLLKGMIMPSEAMNNQSSVILQNWASSNCYIPLFGMMFLVAYIKNNSTWLKKLLLFLCVISFSPLISSSFLLFSESNQRWWFMLLLLAVLATVIAIEKRAEYKWKQTYFVYSLLVLVLIILIVMPYDSSMKNLVFNEKSFMYYIGVTIISFFLSVLISKGMFSIRGIVTLIVLFASVTTGYTFFTYTNGWNDNKTAYIDLFYASTQTDGLDKQYRINSFDNVQTLVGRNSGVGAFSSTVDNKIAEFDQLFDFYSVNTRMDKNSIPGVSKLLGAKYYLSTEKSNEYSKEISLRDGTNYYINEEVACPIGYAVDKCILLEDLLNIECVNRGIALLNAAVIDEEDINIVGKYADIVSKDDINYAAYIDDVVNQNIEAGVLDFSINKKGFVCKSNYENDSLIYLSIPNNVGWSAFIDGDKTDIINSGGMMLLPINAGEHFIEFKYNTPGLMAGVLISIISFVIWMVYSINVRLTRKI